MPFEYHSEPLWCFPLAARTSPEGAAVFGAWTNLTDLKAAMTDGYTTGGGLGLGLSGAKRLSNEFSIESKPGKGTTVTLARWKL